MIKVTQEQFGIKVVECQQIRAHYKGQLKAGVSVLAYGFLGIGMEFYFAFHLFNKVLLFMGIILVPVVLLALRKFCRYLRWWRAMCRVCDWGYKAATAERQVYCDLAVDQFNAAVEAYNRLPK